MFRLLPRLSRSVLAASTSTTILVAGGLTTLYVINGSQQSRTVRLDASGTGNWDSGRGRYDDDLKVNRHKIAAAQGTTPKTPLHNSTPTSLSHPNETAHIPSSGPGPATSPQFGHGSGVSDPDHPSPAGRDPTHPDTEAVFPGDGGKDARSEHGESGAAKKKGKLAAGGGAQPKNTVDGDAVPSGPSFKESGEGTFHSAEELIHDKADEAESKTGSGSGTSQSAYNEETGEINWDCPCLGGMASGPCGPQFRAAFSCFIYSEAEPKGVECVDKFKAMQDCFREHPEQYGEELDDDEQAQSESSPSSSVTPPGTGAAPGYRKDTIPAAPKTEPPASSVIPLQTPENNPSKGRSKLQPKAKGENAPVTKGASQTTPTGQPKEGTTVHV